MTPELKYQRNLLSEAVRFLNVIEQCDIKIAAHHEATYFKTVRQDAILQLKETWEKLLESALLLGQEHEKWTEEIFEDQTPTL